MTENTEPCPIPITREQLLEQVRAAFLEGFSCGADHNNLEYKYPLANISWRISSARQDITGETQTCDCDWYKNGEVTDERTAP